MTIKKLDKTGCSKAEIARLLGVTEGTVRYQLKRLASGRHDGRADQVRVAAAYAEAIDHWRDTCAAGAVTPEDPARVPGVRT